MSVDSPLIYPQGAGQLNQVQFWWRAPANTGGYPISFYTIQCPELPFSGSYPAGANTAVIPVPNGINYYFSITATNTNGVTSAPASFAVISAGVTPDCISAVFVDVISSLYAEVTWETAILPEHQAIHSYLVYAVPSTSYLSTLRFPVYSYASSFNFIGYPSSYGFRVIAVGTGSLGTEKIISTPVVSMAGGARPIKNTTITKNSPTEFTISWTGSQNATSFEFQVYPDDGSPPFFVTPTTLEGQTATFTGCDSWANYQYGVGYGIVIIATNSNGSTNSAINTIHFGPMPASSLTYSGVTPSSFTLRWLGANGASSFQFSLDCGSTIVNNPWSYGNDAIGSTLFTGFNNGSSFRGAVVYALNGTSTIITPSRGFSSFVLAPGQPINFVASLITQSSFSLTWGGAQGASDIAYFGTEPTTTNGVNGPALYTGLSAGSYYSTILVPTNSSGSGVAAGTLIKTTPGAVTNVAQTIGSANTLNITWTSAVGAENYGHVVGGLTSGPIYASTIQAIVVSGLTPNTTYSTTIIAYDVVFPTSGLVGSTLSNYVNLTTGSAAATNLVASNIGSDRFSVGWSGAVGATTLIFHYNSSFVTLAASGIANPYVLTGLTQNTNYVVYIDSVNAYGVTSSVSISQFTAIGLPLLSTSTATSNGFTVYWSGVDTTSSMTFYYNNTSATVSQGSGPSYLVSGLLPNSTYTIYAVAQTPNSQRSSLTYSQLTAPTLPTNVALSGITATQISVSWSAGVTSSLTLYYGASSVLVSASPYTISDLVPNTAYNIYLEAANAAAVYSTVAISQTTGPGPATGLSISNVQALQFDVGWSGAAGASSFTFFYNSLYVTVAAASATIPYTLTGLVANTDYVVYINTTNSIANSSSLTVSQLTAPSVPTGLTIGSVTDKTMAISWVSGIASSFTFFYGPSAITVGGSVTSPYTISSLVANTSYVVYIVATNRTATVSTLSLTQFTAPSATSGVNVSVISYSTIAIAWTTGQGASSLTFYYNTSSLTVSGLETSPYYISSLIAGTDYTFYIDTVSESGLHTSSNSVSVLTVPAPAQVLAASSNTPSSFAVSWSGAQGASSLTFLYNTSSLTVAASQSSPYSISSLSAGSSYSISVNATNATGTVSSNQLTAYTAALAANSLNASNFSLSSFAVSWSGAQGASSLTFVYNSASLTVPASQTSPYTISSLNQSTSYVVYINATTSGGLVTSSMNITATTYISAFAPVGLAASNNTSNSFAISWSGAANASSLTFYYNTSSLTVPASQSSPYTISSLVAGSSYTVYIDAVNIGSVVSSQSITAYTAPALPDNLNVNVISYSSLSVVWTGAQGASSLTFYYNTSSLTVAGSQTSPYLISSLNAGSTYTIYIDAFSNSGLRTSSNSISVLTDPKPAQVLLASLNTPSSFAIGWSGAEGASSMTFLYNTSSITVSGNPANPYSISSLVAGSEYVIRIDATEGFGPPISSNVITAYTKPVGPAGLASSGITASSVTLSWSGVVGASSLVFYYNAASVGIVAQPSPYTLTSLTPGSTYSIYLDAVANSGLNTPSNTISVLMAPLAATSVATGSYSQTGFVITWSGAQGASSLTFRYNSNSVTVANQASPYTLTGLTAGSTYSVSIDATNATATVASGSVNGYTTAYAATSLVASNQGSTSFAIAWSGAAGASSLTFKYNSLSVTVPATQSSPYTLTSLDVNTPYTVYITATTSGGQTTDSASIYASTIVSAPTAITGVSASGITDTSVTVSWSGGVGATSYIYTLNGVNTSPTSDNGVASKTATFSNLAANTQYSLKITAVNVGGSSSSDSLSGLGGLKGWLDGSNPLNTGVVPSNGTTISSWKDKSGNAYNGEWNNIGSVTLVTNSLNSLSGVSMANGGFSKCPIPAGTFINALTIFVVYKGSNFGNTLVTRTNSVTMPNYGNPLDIQDYFGSGTTSIFVGLNNAVAVSTIYNLNNTNASIFNLNIDQTTSAITFYSNATSQILSTGSAWNASDEGDLFSIGGRGDNYLSINATFYEVVTFNTNLTSSSRQVIEGYLAWKWGLQTTLPSSHPYKSAAPSGFPFLLTTLPNPPTAITNVGITELTASSATVSWSGGVGATNYTYTLNGASVTPTSDNGIASKTATFGNLAAGTSYSLIITATNAGGSVKSYGFVSDSSNLNLWLDGKDPFNNRVVPSNGTAITTWVDKSPAGNNATGYGSPQYSNDGVIFNGGQYYLTNLNSKAFVETAFFVIKMNNLIGEQDILSWNYSAGASRGREYMLYEGQMSWIGDNLGNFYRGGAPNLGASAIYVEQYNSRNINMLTNGTSKVSSSAFSFGNTGTQGSVIGSYGTGNYLNATIYEILVFNRFLSTTDIQTVEGYLAWKWGLQTSLPSSHPYYSVPTGFSFTTQESFSPNALSGVPGIHLWLDASDPLATGRAVSNNTVINTWYDKSGNGYNTSEVIGSVSYNSGTGGLTFNGSSYYALPDGALPYGNSDYSFYIVGTCAAGISYQCLIGGGIYAANSSSRFLLIYGHSPSTDTVKILWDNNELNSSIALPGGTPFLYASLWDHTANRRTTFSNGVGGGSDTPTAARLQPSTNNYIGTNGIDVGTANLNGTMYEILVYNVAHTAGQRQIVEGYLAKKWSLQAKLPADHPYKPAGPTNAYTPALSNVQPLYWVDSSNSSALTLSGSSVTGVVNQGIVGGTTVSATSNVTVGTAINSLTTITFASGAGKYVALPSYNANSYLASMFVVFQGTSMGTGGYWFFAGDSGSAPDIGFYNNGAFQYLVVDLMTNEINYRVSTPPLNATATSYTVPTLMSAVANNTSTSPPQGAWVNGTFVSDVAKAGGNTNTNYTNPKLGNFRSDGINYNMAEYVHFPVALTTAQREKVEGYLAWKWGIQTSLPLGHPYYRTRPTTTEAAAATTLPKNIPGLQLWFDASDPLATGTGVSNGTNIAIWYDKSGNAYNTTAVTGSIPYNSTTGGLTFNGSSNFSLPDGCMPFNDSQYSIYVVANIPSSIDNQTILNGGTTGNTYVNLSIRTMSGNNLNACWWGAVDYVVPVSLNSKFLYNTSYGQNGLLTAAVNGTVQGSYGVGGPRVQPPTTNFIGHNPVFGINLNGTIFEILVFNTNHTAELRQKVEGYLAWKWGTQTSLPTNHPYYNTNPSVPQIAPTSLTTGSYRQTSFQISWYGAQLASSLTFRYGSNSVTIANQPSPYTLTTLTAGSTYSVSIDATNATATGSSGSVNGFTTAYAATSLTYSNPTATSFAVAWSGAQGASSLVFFYNGFSNTVSGSQASPLTITTSLGAGSTYTVFISSITSGGLVTTSNSITAYTSPYAATSLSYSNPTVTSFAVAWSGAQGASSLTFFYNGFSNTVAGTQGSPLTLTTSVGAGSTYTVFISSISNSGLVATSNSVTAYTSPYAATSLSYSNPNVTSFVIAWSGAQGASSLVFFYNGFSNTVNAATQGSPLTITTSVGAGSTYTVFISSITSGGLVATSNSVLAYTSPYAATSLSYSNPTVTSFAVAWSGAQGASSLVFFYNGFSNTVNAATQGSPLTLTTSVGAGSTYTVFISSITSGGLVTTSNSITAYTSPYAATSLSYSNPTVTSFAVAWSGAQGASSLVFFYNGFSNTVNAATQGSPLTITTSVGAGSTYTVFISSITSGGLVATSNSVLAYTSPYAATSLSYSNPNVTSFVIAWSGAQGASSLVFFYNNFATTVNAATQGSPLTITTSVGAGSTYTVFISSITRGGLVATSNSITAYTSAYAATSLAASGITSDSANISWSGAQGASALVFKYNSNQVSVGGSQTSPYTLTSLTPGTSYTVYIESVTATSGLVTSSQSISVLTAPLAATSVATGSYSQTGFQITWSGAQGASSLTFRYNSNSVTVANQSSPYNLTGLSAGSTYSVSIDATNATAIASSGSVNGFTTAYAPTGLVASNQGATSFAIAWSGAAGASSLTFNYNSLSVTVPASQSSPYTLTSLATNTSYTVYITATTSAGYTTNSASINTATIANPPTAITGISTTALTATSMTVGWSGGVGATSYTYTLNGVSATPTSDNGVASKTATFGNLAAGTSYSLRITAVNAGGSATSGSSLAALGGLHLWFDGKDPLNTGTAPSNGTSITTWFDKSGNSYNTTGIAGSGTITYNNASGVYFPGPSNSNLSFTLPNGSFPAGDSAYTIYFVGSWDNPSNNTAYNFGNNYAVGLWNANGTIYAPMGHPQRSITLTNTGFAANQRHQTSLIYNPGVSATLVVDGVFPPPSSGVVTNPVSNNITSTGNFLGQGVGATMVGYLSEIIIFNVAHDAGTRQVVEGYLAWRWGAETYLPSSHPYKSAAPTGFPFSFTTPVVPFTPTASTGVPGIQLWLDASDPLGTGTAVSNGTNISTWYDKSGNGYNTTAVTGSISYNSGTGGLTFNGSSYYTLPDGSIPFGNSGYSVYVVATCAAGIQQGLIGGGVTGGSSILNLRYRADNNANTVQTIWYSNDLIPSIALPGGTPFIFASLWDSSAGKRTAFANGTSGGSDTPASIRSQSSSNNWIGTVNYNVGGANLNGTMYEILVYNMAHTAGQRQIVEGYLANKWNLQSSLPADHPYKSVRPSNAYTPALNYVQPLYWIDASNSSALTLSGSSVTGVINQGIAGNTTSASNVTVGTAINSLNTITFGSGGSRHLALPTYAANSYLASMFVVFQGTAISGTSAYWFLTGDSGSAPDMGYYRRSDGAKYVLVNLAAIEINYRVDTAPFNATDTTYTVPTLMSVVANNTSTSLPQGAWVNGTLVTDVLRNGGNTNTNYNNPKIGNNRSDGVSYNMAEYIHFPVALTTSQRQQVEGYLAWKWGTQASLPSSHPFYSARPTVAAAAAATTLPRSIGGLQLWFDAADPLATGTPPANGANIAVWYDKSGNAYNTTGGNTNATYSAAGLVFSGNSQYSLPDGCLPFNDTSYSYFFVLRSPTTNVINPIMSGGNITGSRRCTSFMCYNDSKLQTVWYNEGNYATTTSYPANQTFLTCSLYSSGNQQIVGVNGTINSRTAGVTRIQPPTTNSIGFSVDIANTYFNGTLCEILCYNICLNTTQRQQVEGYLAWKWGIQSSLPETHPYAYFAPGATPSPLTPSSLSSVPGIQLWFDASDPLGTGTAVNDQTNVTTWYDKSGNGFHTTAVTGSIPYSVTRNRLMFNGSSYFTLPNGSFPFNDTPYSIYFVVSFDAADNRAVLVAGTSSGSVHIRNTSSQGFRINSGPSGVETASGTATNGTLVIFNAIYIPGNNIVLFVNGQNRAEQASVGARNTPNSPNYIGYYPGLNTMLGSIGAILVYNVSHTVGQRQIVEGYLANKWNLKSSLPANHPYRN